MKILPFKPTFEKITRPLAIMAKKLEDLNTAESTTAVAKQNQARDLNRQAEEHYAEAAKANTFAKELNKLFGKGPAAA